MITFSLVVIGAGTLTLIRVRSLETLLVQPAVAPARVSLPQEMLEQKPAVSQVAERIWELSGKGLVLGKDDPFASEAALLQTQKPARVAITEVTEPEARDQVTVPATGTTRRKADNQPETPQPAVKVATPQRRQSRQPATRDIVAEAKAEAERRGLRIPFSAPDVSLGGAAQEAGDFSEAVSVSASALPEKQAPGDLPNALSLGAKLPALLAKTDPQAQAPYRELLRLRQAEWYKQSPRVDLTLESAASQLWPYPAALKALTSLGQEQAVRLDPSAGEPAEGAGREPVGLPVADRVNEIAPEKANGEAIMDMPRLELLDWSHVKRPVVWPEVRVLGIAGTEDRWLAVVTVDGQVHQVQAGQSMAALDVIEVRQDTVVLQKDQEERQFGIWQEGKGK